ncbi:ArsR/SmtB family transcription factor [Marinitoga litoralis]|uniref:ArsR/SmtB family transcription factor n=1 Tax=Marinitoga litoralis TaxID=570855 RepID=UPI00196203F9|nr:metalloregulator ArsR/SmtB family transcription factor [Marinitoga litoralis]MBM7560356.1 ArsR family transcriptional regulator [Marinitoga litoralis]
MNKFVEMIKIFSDETRLRILNILFQGEHCNCDLEEVLELSQPNISKHLKKIMLLDLATSRKSSYWTYYKINEEVFNKHPFIIEIMKEIQDLEPFKSDLIKLKEYENSPKRCQINLDKRYSCKEKWS